MMTSGRERLIVGALQKGLEQAPSTPATTALSLHFSELIEARATAPEIKEWLAQALIPQGWSYHPLDSKVHYDVEGNLVDKEGKRQYLLRLNTFPGSRFVHLSLYTPPPLPAQQN